MRIERIQVDAFGTLRDFDSGVDPLGSLVVVLGPNEAGKSTLFGFLTTMLYGFQPASRDRNPHVPWGADEAGGAIRLRTSEETCIGVERRLRSTPVGSLVRGDVETSIRNQPLPWVDHVPRSVFRQVFAVTLAELAGLDDETWARIQDRVLGSMGASDLASPRDVIDVLEREAGEIWRPNRRGNQRLRALQAESREMRARRSTARERDRRVRAIVEERESVEQRLRDVRAEAHHDRAVVDRMQELLPLKRQLDLVHKLRREGGPREVLAGLPVDPRRESERLAVEVQRLRREIDRLEEELGEPEAAVAAFGEEARAILDAQESIGAFLAGDLTGRERASRLREQEQTARDLERAIAAGADRLLTRPLDEEGSRAVAGLSIDLLRDRVERYGDPGDEPPPAPPPQAPPTTPAARHASTGLAAMGAALLAAGLLTDSVVLAAVGAATLAAGMALGLRPRRKERTVSADGGGGASSRPALLADVVDMLRGVPVRAELLDPPGAPLVQGLEQMQKDLADRGRVDEEVADLRQLVESRAEEAKRLARLLDRPAPSDVEAFAGELQTAIREAQRARDRAETSQREMLRLRRARDGAVADVLAVEKRLTDLTDRIRRTVPDASTNALDEVERRLRSHQRADRIEEELVQAHPDLTDLQGRIRAMEAEGVAWTVDDTELAERKGRLESAAATIEELVGRSRALEKDAEHLREMETVDAVDSEMMSLQEEEARLVEERDRKWVLAQLIREADQAFREEHQPDLLKRASAYLARLTRGRYDRLLVDERSGGDLFQLLGPDLPAPVALASPISTGTLEQAYLSLRLAIVDHLDQDRERLPLFIDEAFVNWDARRRDQGLEVLAEVSSSRQVFAFTCHPAMASRLEEHGARVIRLGR